MQRASTRATVITGQVGAAQDGIGTRGIAPTLLFPPMESSIARLAGDSTHRSSYSIPRSFSRDEGSIIGSITSIRTFVQASEASANADAASTNTAETLMSGRGSIPDRTLHTAWTMPDRQCEGRVRYTAQGLDRQAAEQAPSMAEAPSREVVSMAKAVVASMAAVVAAASTVVAAVLATVAVATDGNTKV